MLCVLVYMARDLWLRCLLRRWLFKNDAREIPTEWLNTTFQVLPLVRFGNVTAPAEPNRLYFSEIEVIARILCGGDFLHVWFSCPLWYHVHWWDVFGRLHCAQFLDPPLKPIPYTKVQKAPQSVGASSHQISPDCIFFVNTCQPAPNPLIFIPRISMKLRCGRREGKLQLWVLTVSCCTTAEKENTAERRRLYLEIDIWAPPFFLTILFEHYVSLPIGLTSHPKNSPF